MSRSYPLDIEKIKLKYGLTDLAFSKIQLYIENLEKWSKAYNLIGPHELDHIWDRHIIDCLQLINHLPSISAHPSIIDLGSGAGFPGIILALAGYDKIKLVEKTQKKSQFLEIVSRETSIFPDIINARIEDISYHKEFDIILSRALANLSLLLGYSLKLLAPSGYCLFHKGESVQEEINNALNLYNFKYEKIKESSIPGNIILKVFDIKKK